MIATRPPSGARRDRRAPARGPAPQRAHHVHARDVLIAVMALVVAVWTVGLDVSFAAVLLGILALVVLLILVLTS